MPAENLTGNFNYASLKDAIQKRGVGGANLDAALTKIAGQNNIDDITKLNGSKNITVEGSVFDQYASVVNPAAQITNPFEINKPSDDNKTSQDTSITSLFGNKYKNEEDLPEIFNEDDYDVVDYDDYYNFGGTQGGQNQEQSVAQQDSTRSMNFEEFKEAHMNGTYGNPNFDNATSPFEQASDSDKDATLYNVFSQYDSDNNGILDNNELNQFEEMAKGASTLMPGANSNSLNNKQDIPQEGQDPFGSGAMDMDMQQQAQPESK